MTLDYAAFIIFYDLNPIKTSSEWYVYLILKIILSLHHDFYIQKSMKMLNGTKCLHNSH